MKNKHKIIALIVIMLIVVARSIAEPYHISGDCMEPAFMDGQRYFVNRISPYLRQYQTGDVVVFKHEEKVWISRIVAVGGETIQLTEGNIVVNGRANQDGEVRRNWSDWKFGTYGIDTPLQIPQGYFYVLSDNLTAHHDDSRVFGLVSKESILGRVW
jgi:signal peptidase I